MVDEAGLVRFIIIGPVPDPLRTAIRSQMERIGDLTGSRRALSYPPHVTLRTGALVPRSGIDAFMAGFGDRVRGFPARGGERAPVAIGPAASAEYLDDGGRRKNIILYPVRESAWLRSLNAWLLEFAPYRKSAESAFHPHVSIAYDDLDDESMRLAEEYIMERGAEFSSERAFLLDSVSILEQDPSGAWIERRAFSLIG